jgi:ABC-type amino acid transport substrate-binding protein
VAGTVLNISSQEIYVTQICEAIVSEALNNIGIETSMEKLPTARAAFVSNAGGYDAEACRIKGFADKYQNLIRINPSILSLEVSIFTKSLSLDIERDNWMPLIPYKIGVHSGHFYSSQATKDFPDVVKVITDKQLLKMLTINRIDAAVLIKADAMAVIKELGLEKDIKMLSPPIAQYPIHFFIHKKNKHLEEKISQAIQQIVSSGRAAEIYAKYLSMLESSSNES